MLLDKMAKRKRHVPGVLAIPELLQQIAQYLDFKSTTALAAITKLAQHVLHLENEAALFHRRVSKIWNSAGFNSALYDFQSLSCKFRKQAFMQLGAKIESLPEQQKTQARDSWLAELDKIPNSELLRYIVDPGNLVSHDLILNAAEMAVRNGENVQTVVEQFEITTESTRRGLQWLSVVAPAGDEIKSGSDWRSVAERFGILRKDCVSSLQKRSHDISDGPAIKRRRFAGLVSVAWRPEMNTDVAFHAGTSFQDS